MKTEDKFELADQNAAHDPSLAPYVDRILEAVEHPDALVTDESSIRDFLSFGGEDHLTRRRHPSGQRRLDQGPWEFRPGDPEVKAQNDALLANMIRQFGVPIDRDDLVVAVAHRIRMRERAGAS
jgi:hypothetical protein